MIIGFTGTRSGMSSAQKQVMTNIIAKIPIEEAHHGDCIGADANFHTILQDKGITNIIGHPASGVGNQRAYCQGFAEIREEKPPLERNKDIVDESDMMFATPKEYGEIRRSGTWATIRYARGASTPIVVIYPNGSSDKWGFSE